MDPEIQTTNDSFISEIDELLLILVEEYNKFKQLRTKLNISLYSRQFTWIKQNEKIYVFCKYGTKIHDKINHLKPMTTRVTNRITNNIYFDILNRYVHDSKRFDWTIFKNTRQNELIYSSVDDITSVNSYDDKELINLPNYLCYILERKITDLINIPSYVYLSIDDENFDDFMIQLLDKPDIIIST